MLIKAEFIYEIKSDDPIDAIGDSIYTIFENGESIRDYAYIYTEEHEDDEWVEMK